MRKFFSFLLFSLDLIWLRSSFSKLIDIDKFVNSLAGVLTKFASHNPYPFYKNLLISAAIPNSKFFGILIVLGEAFTAFSLLTGALYFIIKKEENKLINLLVLLGLLTGMILNLNFWLVSGWTSVSSDSLNLLMFLIETLVFVYILKRTVYFL